MRKSQMIEREEPVDDTPVLEVEDGDLVDDDTPEEEVVVEDEAPEEEVPEEEVPQGQFYTPEQIQEIARNAAAEAVKQVTPQKTEPAKPAEPQKSPWELAREWGEKNGVYDPEKLSEKALEYHGQQVIEQVFSVMGPLVEPMVVSNTITEVCEGDPELMKVVRSYIAEGKINANDLKSGARDMILNAARFEIGQQPAARKGFTTPAPTNKAAPKAPAKLTGARARLNAVQLAQLKRFEESTVPYDDEMIIEEFGV